MKTVARYLLGVVFLGSIPAANAESIFTCSPLKPSPLISQLVVEELSGGNAAFTLIQVDDKGQRNERHGNAGYYDDMTYYGYYSEELNTGVEFWGEFAILRLGDQNLYANCDEIKK